MHLTDEPDDEGQPAAPPPPSSAGRWEVVSPTALLIILALINFLNYVDRFVMGGLVPFLLKPEPIGLGLDERQVGWLAAAFMLVHSVASVPLGYLADRMLRKRLIAVGVALWSVATALAGFAQSFAQIFIARAAVGIGEATYAPAASALISDRFTARMRARVLGIFQLGMVLGSAVGIVVGGSVAKEIGWREAFMIVGAPGIVLSLLILLVYEPDPSARRRKPAPGAGRIALRIAPGEAASWTAAAWITVAGILTTFFTGALGFWGPEHILRTLYGGDASHMSTVVWTFGPIGVAASVAGVLTGSFVADRLEKWRPGAGRLYTVAIGVLVSAPCAALAFMTTDRTLLYLMLGVGVFFNVWYIGPILAALHDVVPPRLRATATGAYFLLIHLLGDAFSPLIVGSIAKATGRLSDGLLLATALMACASIASFAAVPASRRVAQLKRAAPQQ